MSYTVVLLPILSVLYLATDKYCAPNQIWQMPNRLWQSVNCKQDFLAHHYWPLSWQQTQFLTPKELSSIVSEDINEVNTFLAQKGFTISLSKPLRGDNAIAIASVLDVLLKWKHKGTEKQFPINGIDYPMIFMPTHQHLDCSVREFPNHQHILTIKTENNETVYLQPVNAGEMLLEGFDLIEYTRNIHDDDLPIDYSYYHALFPMIDLNEQTNIDWLLGLTFPGNASHPEDYEIQEAVQQTKFQMNEEGVAAQSAVAIGITMTGMASPRPEKIFVIDKPFYLWIMRDGIDIPVFAGYMDYDVWKKPAKLGI